MFYDNWLPGGPLCDRIDIASWSHFRNVSEWMVDGRWRITHSFARCHPLIAEEITQIHIFSERDEPLWNGKVNAFSIADCYEVLRYKKQKVEWHNMIWSSVIVPKHSFIAWLFIRGRLKTREFLYSRRITEAQDCGICGREPETIEHLFFGCELSNEVWRRIVVEIGIICQSGVPTRLWRHIARLCRGRSRNARKAKVLATGTIYVIWCERNRRVFQGVSADINTIVLQLKMFLNLKRSVF